MGRVEDALARLNDDGVVGRIWARDHTAWKPHPEEVADRLGWLDAPARMRPRVPELTAFADSVRADGFRHVVLLGMGGSSLGAEVLRTTLGRRDGYPALIVLDSTVPAAVRAVSEAIDPERTLFLVSSKSGTTTEPNVLYRHFRTLVDRGTNFAAITDAGTPLAALGEREGFRHIFLNAEDIGGRYSVLSHFGLVPAVLAGIDVAELLARAEAMAGRCEAADASENPGAALGAAMGAHALAGRDKLTLVTSPGIDSFGLWAEQLVAESTGKEGAGIVPVCGEPLRRPVAYGADRLFVYLRLDGDANRETDELVDSVESAGHPVVRIGLADAYDLGGELFRWQFATAIAGSILGVNPFDQPDVQFAKERTEDLLAEYASSGRLPAVESLSLEELASRADPGRYLAVVAFVEQTPATDAALTRLRRAFMDRFRVATTVAYGPRFLHSTGQLHKGGPDGALVLQLTAGQADDLPIPGEPYTFGTLLDAQALGDIAALRERGRPVAHMRLGPDAPSDIARLAREVGA